ncbi:MAG: RNA polymerase sigma factor [Proteobacteria bacterium]|nr:RNA polymerase sigma factor [Pseudomonadota bacterium]
MNCHLNNITDEALLALSEHDQDSFYALMKRYEKKLFAYIRRMTPMSREDAEDILQEVYIKVYKHQKGFDPDLKFSSWIYRITHNEVVNMLRKRKIRSGTVSIDNTESDSGAFLALLADTMDIQETYISEERGVKIRKALFHLPEKYREVLVLRYFEEKSYGEIGDILKIPQGTVATMVNRAKKRFEKASRQLNLTFQERQQ